MRKLFLLATVALFASCSSDTSPAPPPASPVVPDTAGKRWVRFWQGGDTLITDYGDMVITFKDGDTSGIYANGIKLYLWQEKVSGMLFLDSTMSVGPVRLGTSPFAGVIASNQNNFCWPAKHYGFGGFGSTQESQPQGLCILDNTGILADSLIYKSNKTLP